jgi:tRNA (guanine26-N2/guanine27-N2)-dimethyltransferase
VSGSHANPLAVKTDAPFSVIWDIIRCWVRQHPVSKTSENKNPYAAKLLAKPPALEANFTRASGAVSAAKLQGVPRFVENPPEWGPMARAGRPERPPQEAGAARGGKRRADADAEGGPEPKAPAVGEGEAPKGDAPAA